MTGLRVSLFSILFLLSTHLLAESYRMNASYWVRSSPNFSSQDRNKVGILTLGSSFRVLNSVTMSDGAEALQIRVTSLSPTSNVNPAKEYWIYKTKSDDFIKLNNDPRETQADSLDLPCKECGRPQAKTQNSTDLGKISQRITRDENIVPTEKPTPTPLPPQATGGNLDEKIRNYSNSEEVEYAINSALKHKTSRSRGQCYHSVKEALAAHPHGKKGLIPNLYSDEAARHAEVELKNFGFVNLLDSDPYKSQITLASQAPKGAVLVYSSGIPCRRSRVPDCGHIEIKTGRRGDNAYVSDYSDSTPINETPAALRYHSRYHLIGVMIKPMD